MYFTGADRKMTCWAETVVSRACETTKAVAPHVSSGRCIVYVDFVGDVVPLALKLSEEFGIPTGRCRQDLVGRGPLNPPL